MISLARSDFHRFCIFACYVEIITSKSQLVEKLMEGQGISLGTQVISMSFNFGQFQFIFLLEHMTRLVAS